MATKTTVGSDDTTTRIIGAIIFLVRSYFYTVNLTDNARAHLLGCHIHLNSTSIDVGTCTAAVIHLGMQCSICVLETGGEKLEHIYGVNQEIKG